MTKALGEGVILKICPSIEILSTKLAKHTSADIFEKYACFSLSASVKVRIKSKSGEITKTLA